MYTGMIKYATEDAAYDELEGLEHFRERNLHPEHDWDIDLVTYEMDGDIIRFESGDREALAYVMEFASENEDNVLYRSTGSTV